MKRRFITLILMILPYRLYHLTYPLLDAFHFRQTQTATFAANLYKHGFNFGRTELDIFGLGKEKYLTLEFPFYESVVALLNHLTPALDVWGRLVTIGAGYVGAWYLYRLVQRVTGREDLGILSAAFFLTVPLNLFYQRTVMIDPTIIACLLAGLYYACEWIRTGSSTGYILSIVLLTLGFVQKGLYGPFWLLPIAVVFYRQRGINLRHWRSLFSLLGIGFIPLTILLLWQRHVDLQNIHNGQLFFTTQNAGHLAWNFGDWSDRKSLLLWRQLSGQLLNGLFLKPGLVLFLIGCFTVSRHDRSWFFRSFLLSQLLYFLIVFRIQVQNYYQLVMVPAVVPVMAIGAWSLVRWFFHGRVLRSASLAIIIAGFLWRSWVGIQPSYFIDWNWLHRIQAIEQVTPRGSAGIFAVAGTEWNSSFTYYSHRILKHVTIDQVTPDQVRQWKQQGYPFIIFYAREQYPDYLKHLHSDHQPDFLFHNPHLLENQEFSIYQL